VRPNAAAVLGVQGPLARSAEDLELGLNVTAGPEVGEDVAWRLDLPAPRAERLADLRVAIMPRIGWLPVSVEILEAMDAFAAGLARAGAMVKVAQPESFGDMRDHHQLYLSMLLAVTSARLTPDLREQQVQQLLEGGLPQDEWASARLAGLRATVGDWFTWHARREAFRAAYRAFFTEWDILLAPITLRTAFPHIQMSWPPSDEDRALTIDIDGQAIPYGNQVVYPGVATLCGQPATALPIGLSPTGLPIGLQAIGPYLEDRTPIRFAALATRELGGFLRPPGFE
jgi:amidase